LNRYFPDANTRRLVNTEFAKFSTALDVFSNHGSLNDRGLMDPKQWWVLYGSSTPTLQVLALKLLRQPCSSLCCERNWSTYSFIPWLGIKWPRKEHKTWLMCIPISIYFLEAPHNTMKEKKRCGILRVMSSKYLKAPVF